LLNTVVLPWFQDQVAAALAGSSTRSEPLAFSLGARDLSVRFLGSVGRGEFMLLLDEPASIHTIATLMQAFPLTQREAEVLLWVAKGKTNRDIAEILEMSPRTVNKHLEHVFVKLGVETRTAAAALVNGRRA
jgi:DNA-binding CsgD family transcriptional regulator